MILEGIETSSDIKKLNAKQIGLLAGEIRSFLLDSVSKTGGHLASNLGVVELTLALHAVFDLPQDKLVWDVGHQCYVHKMLTGRCEKFGSLRQFDGLSGFPKTNESEYDSFNTGHSSTSISAALGLAKARDLSGGDHHVVAVIGDGAMTGGMAYEALNNAAVANTRLIVVLNDNAMSISRNVGGLSDYLNRITNREGYFKMKDQIDRTLHRIPGVGHKLFLALRSFKNWIKYLFVPDKLFTELGFKYFGPIDGHDFRKVSLVLQQAKTRKEPVLVHVCTKKGKGYQYAESNPDSFHGIAKFDLETGRTIQLGKKESYSSMFGDYLCKLAEDYDKICAITAAMPCGTGLERFSKRYPKRFFDVGIAEQHAVTFAAGLAAGGYVPVVAVYSSFLQRAYDQILHDVALQNLHVVFAIDRAGIVGEDGETHQGLYDMAFLSSIPNMTVLAAADYTELKRMMDFAVTCRGPVAIRYPRGRAEGILSEGGPVEMGKGRLLYDGKDVVLLAVGRMTGVAVKARELLRKRGISAAVADLRFAKPLDEKLILQMAQKTGFVVSLEDGACCGGVGERIAALLRDLSCRILIKSFPDEFVCQGKTTILFQKYRMDAESIAQEILGQMELRA